MENRKVTEKDLQDNPQWAEKQIKVGDDYPAESYETSNNDQQEDPEGDTKPPTGPPPTNLPPQ